MGLLKQLMYVNMFLQQQQQQQLQYKMAKQTNTVQKRVKIKVSRPGVHSKNKTSKLKSSKNYKKSYSGQGR